MTIRTAVLDALAIGGLLRAVACVMIFAVFLVMAAIGTVTKPELRPLHASGAWIRAHRWPLIGLRWGARGAHQLGRRLTEAATLDDWYPLDEEEDDGQPAETPARDRQPRAEADDARREVRPDGEAVHAQGTRVGAHHGALADGEPAGDLSQHHDDWVSGRFTHEGEDDDDAGQAGGVRELRRADQDAAEVEGHLGSRRDGRSALPPPDAGDPPGDLTTGDDYDAALPPVRPRGTEPEWPELPTDDDVLNTMHDLAEQERGTVPAHEPHDPPGPDRAGADSSPVTTAACPAVELTVKADSTGPGTTTEDSSGPDPALDVDTPTGTGPGALTRFAAVLRRHRDRPVNFWSVQALEDVCATAARIAYAESVIKGAA